MTNKLIFLLSLLIALLTFGCYYFHTQNTKLSDALLERESFLSALQDTARTYKDELGREVLAKKAIQANLATLTSNYKLLSGNQKKLADNIKLLPKQTQKSLVAATELKQEARIDKLVSVDSTHHWQSHTDTLSYSIRATGDTLTIDSLAIPNQLFLTQQKAKNGAILVTATNSNPLIKNKGIDSIIIPVKKPSPLVKILLFIAGVAGGIIVSR